MKLSKTTIKTSGNEKANNKADLLLDDETRGFGIRVYPSGRKSFFVYYLNSSKTKKRNHVFPTLGLRKLAEITIRQVQNIQTSIKKKLCPSTANRVTRLIKQLFIVADKWFLIAENPSEHLTMFREPAPKDIVQSPENYRKLIDGYDKDDHLFYLMYFFITSEWNLRGKPLTAQGRPVI